MSCCASAKNNPKRPSIGIRTGMSKAAALRHLSTILSVLDFETSRKHPAAIRLCILGKSLGSAGLERCACFEITRC